jgi:hypothetical protein
MNKFWLSLVLAAAAGTTVAWAINYQRYGHRIARFGPFTMDGDVTPSTVATFLSKDLPTGLARAELKGDNSHDFGMMPPGSEGEHVFVVKNVGEEELTLRLGATTCKCTLGELDRESLAPGEETEIKLSWTVKPGETEFAQSAQLITNDPVNVVIQLEIIGKVISDVEVVPETWSFGDVAAGEPFEVKGTIYSFLDTDISPISMAFSSKEMTELSEFQIEPFVPTEDVDGIRSAARQGFRVTATVAAGMRQGAVSQQFILGFKRLDEKGKEIPPEEGVSDEGQFIMASTKGQIVGQLGMLTNSKLEGRQGGGYVYDFGRIGKDDPLKANTFVVFKGSERNHTKLRVGEIFPDHVIKATLGEPKGRGSMLLYPLEIELVPGNEPIERLGKSKDDYGSVWIESDNPKVTRMRVALKFALEGR